MSDLVEISSVLNKSEVKVDDRVKLLGFARRIYVEIL